MRIQSMDAVMIPFSLIWCGFAVFWEYSAFRTGAPLLFKLWGIPFLLVGLYFVVGRFFSDAYVRQHTHYGITADRAIIVSGAWSRQVRSLPLRSLGEISLRQHADGTGTILFGSPLVVGAPDAGYSRRYSPPSFAFIADARGVYELIVKLQRSAA